MGSVLCTLYSSQADMILLHCASSTFKSETNQITSSQDMLKKTGEVHDRNEASKMTVAKKKKSEQYSNCGGKRSHKKTLTKKKVTQ